MTPRLRLWQRASRARDPVIQLRFTLSAYGRPRDGLRMVAIVNGYVCFSTCDAKSAQQGRDPNAPPGSPPGTKAHKPGDPASSFDGQPATTFGGALADLLTSNAVTASDPSQQAGGPQQRNVDRYA